MEERIFFNNSKGDKLCGVLSDPGKHSPLLILSHGFSSSKNGRTFTALQERLNSHGIATLRFDFFGHGESEGLFEDITVTEGVDDAIQAIAFAKTRGYNKIGLFGSSFGGHISIIAASTHQELFCLCLKSPVSYWPDIHYRQQPGLEKPGYIMYKNSSQEIKWFKSSFVDDAKKHNGYEAAKAISAPTLIVIGSDDEVVPYASAKRLSKNIKRCTLKPIESADHAYSKPEDFERMLRYCVDFLVEKAQQ